MFLRQPIVDTNSNPAPANLDAGGNLKVNVAAGGGSGGTSSTFGDPLPATGTAIGFQDSTGDMAPGLLDASGFLKVNVSAGGAGGGAVTVADGADVTEGAIADAAIFTDTTGTVSGKLRGLVKILANVWDSVSSWLQVKVMNGVLATPLRTDPVGTTTQPVSGTVTSNAGTNLNTSALALETGGNLASIKVKTDNIPAQGQALAAASLPVVLTAIQVTTLTPPAAITGFALEAGVLATINAKLVSGTDIGDVTINNAAGAAAVNIQDGGNTITVDGAVTVTNATATNLKAEVVGTGTFAVQAAATLNAETTKVIGTVNIAASQTVGLVAGTATIGKLDANSGVDIGDVDVTSVLPGTGATSLGKAEDGAHTSGDVGVMALAVANEANTARAADSDYLPIAVDTEGNVRNVGNRDHDAVDAGEPVKVGGVAIAHGTNPTAVAAADRTNLYANRAGVQFVIGGHPNVVTLRANYTAAQTDTAIVTVATGLKIIVTRASVTADGANSVNVAVRIGFGTANTPTTTGVVLSHPGIVKGSGVVEGSGAGILGVGADDADLRITSTVPTGGSIDVVVSYYTIES